MNKPDKKLEEIFSIDQKLEKKDEKVTGLFRTHPKTGEILKNLYNLRIMIENDPITNGLKFNEFTNVIQVRDDEVNDAFIRQLRINIDKNHWMDFSENDIFTQVDGIAKDNSFHPIKQMIESKHWDGVERAETLFIDYLGANDDRYIRETTRKWLAGSVARVYQPGVKFEIIPILQGNQGIGKSTIASKIGGTYFTDSLQGLGNSKDDYQMLIGTWIVELGELSSMSSTKVETIKGFTSATEDKIRLPYERITQTFKRTVSFIGTTNPKEYLKDLTGNRRFFPIPLEKDKAKKDVFKLDDETIQQIWAEAYCYYKAGEKLFIPHDDVETHALAEVYRDEATEESMIHSDIHDFLNMNVEKDWNNLSVRDKRYRFIQYQDGEYSRGVDQIDRTTTREIARVVFNLENTDRNQKNYMKQIKMYMDGLQGWEYQTVYINKKRVKGYKKTW